MVAVCVCVCVHAAELATSSQFIVGDSMSKVVNMHPLHDTNGGGGIGAPFAYPPLSAWHNIMIRKL